MLIIKKFRIYIIKILIKMILLQILKLILNLLIRLNYKKNQNNKNKIQLIKIYNKNNQINNQITLKYKK